MIDNTTLAMLNSLVQLDYGFNNGKGVMFYESNDEDSVVSVRGAPYLRLKR